VNKSTLEKLTKELKVVGFTDFKEMFQKVKMDFVIIALPHHLHLKAVREASTKGIHILKVVGYTHIEGITMRLKK